MNKEDNCIGCEPKEFCTPISSDCVLYKGSTLTEVIASLEDSKDIADTSDSEVNDFTEVVCKGVSTCVEGLSVQPISYNLTKDLAFTYDLKPLLNSLDSSVTFVRSKVVGYSNSTFLNTNNISGGLNVSLEQLPAVIDIDVVIKTECGLVTLTNSITLGCNTIGEENLILLPKLNNTLSFSNQTDYNDYVKSELGVIKNRLSISQSKIKLPVSDLYPITELTPNSSIIVNSDNIIKIDERLSKLEGIKPCYDECSNCPNGGEVGIEKAYNVLCEKLEEALQTINTLQNRVTELETFH